MMKHSIGDIFFIIIFFEAVCTVNNSQSHTRQKRQIYPDQ